MKIKAGSNLTKVKQANDISILGMIYQNGPVSRGEVARQLEITLPTVTTTVKRLLEKGVIRETEMKEQDFSLGRKAMAVDIAADSRFVAGVEWSPFGLICCISDLRGNIRIRKRYDEPELCGNYERLIYLTGVYVEEMLKESGILRERLAGVGWTAPGMVDAENGILVCSSIGGVDWKRKLVRADLEELLGMPVAVENHVKARAIGQDLFCRAARPDVYLYYFVQAGISCCIMVGGEPFGKGKQGTGDIGHAIMDLDGPVCNCGKRGCLQVFSGEAMLLKRAKALEEEGKCPVLAGLTAKGEPLTMELLLQAAADRDPDVEEMLQTGVRYMGISIANIVNLVNSPLVVIDSAVTSVPSMREYLDRVIREHNYFKEELELETDYVAANRYTGALGACAVAVKELVIRRP